MEFYQTDCQTLRSQIQCQEKQIQLKRRWLLGLPLSEAEQKHFELPDGRHPLPESLLRQDDLFYETAKSAVQLAFGACNVEKGNDQDNVPILDRKSIITALSSSSCLDDLTTKGVHLIATTLTGGSGKFKPTHFHMKKIIKESVQTKFGRQNSGDDEFSVFEQLSQHLTDPQNFRDNFGRVLSKARAQSYCLEVRKVLDRLEDFPLQTLYVMHKKLKGKQCLPQLEHQLERHNRSARLIGFVRKTCEEMLSELGTGDELQEPLTKAMAVASLSLKLQPGFHNYPVTEFQEFSPEIKKLQDDLVTAIKLVDTKLDVPVPELQALKSILGRDAEVPIRSLRFAIKKMLTGYLFECADMDSIPLSLFEALDIINKRRKKLGRRILKDEVEQEVECILNVSAQAKQIMWDMFPDNELDQDYADAYVEEMEDEEDEEDDEDDGDDRSSNDDNNHNHGLPHSLFLSGIDRSHAEGSQSDNESIGESRPFISNLPTATTTRSDCNPVSNSSVFHVTSTERHGPEHNTGMDAEDPLHVEPDDVCKKSTCNQYLAIQEVCDKTSMKAHDFIGHMLEEFAWIVGLDLDCDDTLYLKGDCATQEDSEVVEERQTSSQEKKDGSVIVRVIEDLIPSFPKSGIEALRNLAGD